ncbi:MAG: hypothetical protein KDD89_03925 [Anaerolineales bacterium]|nr:hypothetical protein [Anaerolineales bacterium]
MADIHNPDPTADDDQQPTPGNAEDIYTAPSQPEFDPAEALTRVLIGLTVEGQRELIKRLQAWEEIAHSANDPLAIQASDVAASQLRYALIGYLLETQAQARHSASKLLELIDVSSRLALTTINLMLVTVRPASNRLLTSRYVQPRYDSATNRFDYLVARGERELRRWTARGQLEDMPSRAMGRHAVLDSIDEFIDYLSKNDQIAQLVQEQSVGLAGEVVTEVREYSVSADNALESIVRRLLRRAPRPTIMDIDPNNVIENETD